MKRVIFINMLILSIVLYSCENDPIPKPNGMLRLEYPNATYASVEKVCPYIFKVSKEATVNIMDNCSMILNYPQMNASIYITYKAVNKNLDKLLQDAQKLTYEHVAKADNIQEQPFVNPDSKAYGMFYLVSGNAASASQFYITDSISHFLAGSLYFNTKPNYDSVLPAVKYLEKDIRKIMESLKWQN